MIVLLSYEQHYPNEASLLNTMFEQGLTHFHLRKPNWTLTETETFLKQIDATYHNRIVLHDHYALQTAYNVKGVHFNGRNRESWNMFAAQAKSTSASFHSFEEVQNNGHAFDYVFLSPIFDSISKTGYTAAFDDNHLAQFLQEKHETKILALGGVKRSNINRCEEMGFDGVAVLGTVWKSNHPTNTLKTIINRVKETY